MAQLKDLTVTGNSVFNGTVTLNADPTSAMQAATKQYVDNQGGGGSGDCVVILISDYTVTFDSGSTTTGTISQGIYTAISTAYNSGKVPVIIDADGALDANDGATKTYYFSDAASGFSFISPPDTDSHTNVLWRLIIGAQDEFEIETISLGGGSGGSDVYFWGSDELGITLDATPDTGTVVSGTVGSGTYDTLLGISINSKMIVITDEDNIFNIYECPQFIYLSQSHQNFDGECFNFISCYEVNRHLILLQINENDDFRIIDISEEAGVWGKSSSNGVYYPSVISSDNSNLANGSLTLFSGSASQAIGAKTGQASLNLQAYTGFSLSASHAAGSTSYTINNSTLGPGNDATYLTTLYFYSAQHYTALKPSSVTVSGANSTITFTESLNPTSAISQLNVLNYDAGAFSILAGSGAYNAGYGNVNVGTLVSNTGHYSVVSGNKSSNSGQGNIIGGNRNKVTGHYVVANGQSNLVTANRALISGLGHNTTNGPANVAAVGAYSSISSDTAFAVGIGTADNARSNAFEVHTDGRATAGADPTNNLDLATKQYVDGGDGFIIEVPTTLYDGNTPVNGDSTVFNAAKTAMQAGKKVYIKIKAEQVEGTSGTSSNWVYHLLSGYHNYSSASIESMVFMWTDFFGGESKNIRIIFSTVSSMVANWSLVVDTYATASGVSF